MIQYRQCREGVFAPSDWPDTHEAVCRRSASKPEAYLKLEHVFGYSGLGNTAPNLFYTAAGDVVYYTAGVGIVYNDETNAQKVSCKALSFCCVSFLLCFRCLSI
eukprot:SAG22_NODE_5370_length_1026_cov_2.165049_1_plen_104_part_00